MKRTFVQFALDIDTIGYLKLIAIERRMTMTSLLQNIVFEYLSQFVEKKISESQNAETQKEVI